MIIKQTNTEAKLLITTKNALSQRLSQIMISKQIENDVNKEESFKTNPKASLKIIENIHNNNEKNILDLEKETPKKEHKFESEGRKKLETTFKRNLSLPFQNSKQKAIFLNNQLTNRINRINKIREAKKVENFGSNSRRDFSERNVLSSKPVELSPYLQIFSFSGKHVESKQQSLAPLSSAKIQHIQTLLRNSSQKCNQSHRFVPPRMPLQNKTPLNKQPLNSNAKNIFRSQPNRCNIRKSLRINRTNKDIQSLIGNLKL